MERASVGPAKPEAARARFRRRRAMARIAFATGDNGGMENNPAPPPPLEKARLERAIEAIADGPPLDAPELAAAVAAALSAHLDGKPAPDSARRALDEMSEAVPSNSAPPD